MSHSFELDLRNKFETRQGVIAVVGLGYVGLPLILAFAEAGFQTLGFDLDQTKVDLLNAGKGYIAHIDDERIKAASSTKHLKCTTDLTQISQADAIIICVPTPLGSHREPDLSFVSNTLNSILPHLRKGQLLSLESTTYPGTTEEILKPPLEKQGFTIGSDFFLIYSPEREDPGNPDFGTRQIPKVLGGTTVQCAQLGVLLYEKIIDRVVLVSSTQAAELTKLLENIYRSVNISLVNELKMVADRMGLDIFEVINAAATKPFGFTPFYPGPGIGGHCIPIDPFYLTWKAQAYGIHTRFIELAGEVNQAMPQWVVDKLALALNDQGKPIKGSNILVLGVAYKKNVGDMRESAAIMVLEILRERGAKLSYSDPHVPVFPQKLRRGSFELTSVQLTAETLAEADGVVLITDHAAFDYELIARHARLIIDTRGVFSVTDPNVVRA